MDSSAEVFQWLASLGVGGILAGGMFLVYRKDARRWQEQWKGQSEALAQIVKENTSASVELIQYLKRENGRQR